MSRLLAAFVSALLFGLGLGLSGMTLPAKVLGFLDITGRWDPSLMAVMLGAIVVHALSYRFVIRRARPVFAAKFDIPTRRDLDWKLLLGAAIFGVGWGLGGLCPGPALVGLVTGRSSVVLFVASMICGIYSYRLVNLLARGAHRKERLVEVEHRMHRHST